MPSTRSPRKKQRVVHAQVASLDDNDMETEDTTNVICHANEIPPELLELIFWDCLDPKKMVKLQQQEVPVLLQLAQVCRYWRNVALSRPALWSSLDSPYDGCRISENNLQLLRLWLERSKDHPLTIKMPSQFDPRQNLHMVKLPLDFSQPFNPVICELSQHIIRWRNIIVEVESSAVAELARIGEKLLNAPLLQRVEFWHAKPGGLRSIGEDVSPGWLTKTLTSINSLREIVWSCYLPYNLLSLQWPFLSSVTIDQVEMGTDHCLLFLSQCPRLEKFQLNCYRNSGVLPGDAITLPLLRLLHLETQDPESTDTGELLDHLVLPSLRSLAMVPPKDDLTLNRLGERSSCQLTYLSLIDINWWSETISEFDPLVYIQTPCVTTIRSLTINSITSDDLVNFLIWHPKDASRQHLPLLEMINLRCFTTNGLVATMIASRRHISGHQREQKLVRQPARLSFANLHLLRYARQKVDNTQTCLPEANYSRDVAFFQYINRLRVQASLKFQARVKGGIAGYCLMIAVWFSS